MAVDIVINHTNHFWQTPDMIEAVEKIHQYIQSLPYAYNQIITFGACHGGTGAILFSEQLKETRVLALTPQLQFNDPDRPPELTWMWSVWKKAMGLKQIFSFPRKYKSCEYYILYGYHHQGDSIIMQDPKGLPSIVENMDQCHIYPLDTNTHDGLVAFMRTAINFRSVIDSVDAGNPDEVRLKLSPVLIPFARHPDYTPPAVTFGPALPVINIDEISTYCMGKSNTNDAIEQLNEHIINFNHVLRISMSHQLNQLLGFEVVKGIERIDYRSMKEIDHTP
jgi:hypothetical protein